MYIFNIFASDTVTEMCVFWENSNDCDDENVNDLQKKYKINCESYIFNIFTSDAVTKMCVFWKNNNDCNDRDVDDL